MLLRLVTGCSWRIAARFVAASASTLRRRRDEWVAAGVFERLVEAIAAYDRICGLDLSEVSIDGSLHKAPCGGEGTGPHPTDRGKRGWKWSLVTEGLGGPIGWAGDGANCHDIPLLAPTLAAVETRGLLIDIETPHLDRGYDADTVRSTLERYGIDDAIIFEKCRRGDPNLPHNRHRWGCAGVWNPPTRGHRTTANRDETLTGSLSTGSLSPHSRLC